MKCQVGSSHEVSSNKGEFPPLLKAKAGAFYLVNEIQH